ncbi:hypothetical protein ABZS66_06105 [Dactylosporangium sp. NPDC005572]|uniref:hypothetical protein n=1 Tax=Dactylosporangium sp. NPDC005572 TaxID=3156889 RepID=UPI0033B4DE0E
MRTGLLFVVLLLTGACFAAPSGGGGDSSFEWVDMTPEALVGTWRDTRTGDGIEFLSDGDFYADNLTHLLNRDGASPSPGAGSGSWSIRKLAGHLDGPDASVSLYFDVDRGVPAASGNNLEVQRVQDEVQLVIYVGDPDLDHAVRYHRVEGTSIHRAQPGPPADVTRDQVIGEWLDQATGRSIIVDSDGSFHADDVSFLFRAPPFAFPSPAPGDGTWTIEHAAWDPTGPWSMLHLQFKNVAGGPLHFGSRPMPLYGQSPSLLLTNYTSDESINPRHVYTKRPGT